MGNNLQIFAIIFITVGKEIIPTNSSNLAASEIEKGKRKITLFADSNDPIKLVIENEGSIVFIRDNTPFRRVCLPFSTPQKPVKVLATTSPQNPSLWFIRQDPGVVINSGEKTIKDNGLFGIKCSVNPETKETNPPEISQLIQIAQELGWNIDSYVIALLGMVNN